MLKIENTDVYGFEAAIRGMRSPMNSWDQSDSYWVEKEGSCWDGTYHIGHNDLKLMKNLVKAGSDHAKFLRMINVTADITAMQPWWMEWDTYKVGTVRNSCSKMHKIHVKDFTAGDFEHTGIDEVGGYAKEAFTTVLAACEWLRQCYNASQKKKYWRALIELLPEGYKMRATIQLNYQVLRNQYHARKNHKLVEWHEYCEWVKSLPFSELIIGEEE